MIGQITEVALLNKVPHVFWSRANFDGLVLLCGVIDHANRLRFTPDGKLVLISEFAKRRSGHLRRRIAQEFKRTGLGHGSAGTPADPDGVRAFVARSPDNYIAILDPKSFTVAGQLDVDDWVWSEFLLSRFPVGSSANKIAGPFAMARAIGTRCCSPPEIARGLCCKHLNAIGAINSFNGIADHAAERISHWALRKYFDTVCRNGFEAGGAGTLPCRI